jgi:hypothetical protein
LFSGYETCFKLRQNNKENGRNKEQYGKECWQSNTPGDRFYSLFFRHGFLNDYIKKLFRKLPYLTSILWPLF